MAYEIVRTDEEIDDVLDKCFEAEQSGSKYRGMSYEQGIRYVIDWLTQECMEHPFDE